MRFQPENDKQWQDDFRMDENISGNILI